MRRALPLLLLIAAIAFPSAAAAETVTIGSLAPAGSSSMCLSCQMIQLGTDPAAPSYAVPSGNWTVVSWSTQAGTMTAGNVRLMVWRATSTAGQYQMVGASPFQLVSPNSAPSVPVSIPVQGGDLLGRSSGNPSGDIPTTYASFYSSDSYAGVQTGSLVQVGETAGPTVPPSTYHLAAPSSNTRLNIAATLSRPDQVAPTGARVRTKCKRKKKHASAAKKKCKKHRKKK